MKTDLKTPCKNCPFANRPSRITFRGMERAAEIEESAYRNGFPCHLSAEWTEYGDGEEGAVPGDKTQHCAGAIGMFLNAGYSEWPGVDNEEPPGDYSPAQKVAFGSIEEFVEANRDAAFDGAA